MRTFIQCLPPVALLYSYPTFPSHPCRGYLVYSPLCETRNRAQLFLCLLMGIWQILLNKTIILFTLISNQRGFLFDNSAFGNSKFICHDYQSKAIFLSRVIIIGHFFGFILFKLIILFVNFCNILPLGLVCKSPLLIYNGILSHFPTLITLITFHCPFLHYCNAGTVLRHSCLFSNFIMQLYKIQCLKL